MASNLLCCLPCASFVEKFSTQGGKLRQEQDMQDTLLDPLCFNHYFFGCPQTCSYTLNTMAQIDMKERKNIPPRVEYRSKWGHPEYMYILNALKGRWCSLVVTRCFDFATVTRCLQALFCQFDLTLEKKTPTSRRCLSSYLANFVCLLLFSAPPLAQLLIAVQFWCQHFCKNVSFCNKSTTRQHLPAHLAWLIAVWLFDIQLIHYSCPLLSLIEKAKNTVVPSSSSSSSFTFHN